MGTIVLKVFGGMVPRRGEQHLEVVSAKEAENTLLYSGELRPLNLPSLAHRFASPEDFEFSEPTDPPIVSDPGYDADSYYDAVLALGPIGYWPMDDPDVTDVTDAGTKGNDLVVYGTEQYPLQPSFLDDNRTSWLVDATVVAAPAFSPERLGYAKAALVEPQGGTWIVSALPAGGDNLFRVDLTASRYIRIIYTEGTDLPDGNVFGTVTQSGIDEPADYSNYGVPVHVEDTGEAHVFAVQLEPNEGRISIWIDFVKAAVWYPTGSMSVGSPNERVFSIADRGGMNVQHGVNFNKILSYGDMDTLSLAYQRSFLGYVSPPL